VSDHWSQYHVHQPKEESPPRSVRTYEIDADRDKVAADLDVDKVAADVDVDKVAADVDVDKPK
jgi:hypothetical protein